MKIYIIFYIASDDNVNAFFIFGFFFMMGAKENHLGQTPHN